MPGGAVDRRIDPGQAVVDLSPTRETTELTLLEIARAFPHVQKGSAPRQVRDRLVQGKPVVLTGAGNAQQGPSHIRRAIWPLFQATVVATGSTLQPPLPPQKTTPPPPSSVTTPSLISISMCATIAMSETLAQWCPMLSIRFDVEKRPREKKQSSSSSDASSPSPSSNTIRSAVAASTPSSFSAANQLSTASSLTAVGDRENALSPKPQAPIKVTTELTSVAIDLDDARYSPFKAGTSTESPLGKLSGLDPAVRDSGRFDRLPLGLHNLRRILHVRHGTVPETKDHHEGGPSA